MFCVSRVPGLGFVVNQSRYGVWDFFGCFFLMLIGSREFEICAFGTCDSIGLSKFCLRGMCCDAMLLALSNSFFLHSYSFDDGAYVNFYSCNLSTFRLVWKSALFHILARRDDDDDAMLDYRLGSD